MGSNPIDRPISFQFVRPGAGAHFDSGFASGRCHLMTGSIADLYEALKQAGAPEESAFTNGDEAGVRAKRRKPSAA